ncbi:MAG TPA: DUF2007 domain-containing protein [Gemmatimonadales bacterium]|jgi:hypothetical protein|nr:DUF2007 domain-containing protein [Gemmatimonadales bacterium]
MAIVVVGHYPTELEAQLGQAVLEANGISSIIMRDDAGGMLPSLHLLAEVRLGVHEEDAEEAKALLEETPEG